MKLSRVPSYVLSLYAILAIIILPGWPAAAQPSSIAIRLPSEGNNPLKPDDALDNRPRMVILNERDRSDTARDLLKDQGWEPANITLDFDLPETAVPENAPTVEMTSGWTTIVSESFEGSFPAPGWQALDANGPNEGGNVYWGKESYLHYGGSYSAWAAGGGVNGRNPAVSGYPNNMLSYMIYGPFNLAGAQRAALTFSYWLDSDEKDKFYVMVATDKDGTSYSGWSRGGDSNGWQTMTLDLESISGLDIANSSFIRIAFIFNSDKNGDGVKKGPFVDDILLEKCYGPDITFTTPDTLANPWSGPIVASNIKGTYQTVQPLYTHEYAYIDWAILNQGSIATEEEFTNCLYLDDQLVKCMPHQTPLGGKSAASVEDYKLTLRPLNGLRTLKVVFDVGNNIAETDETNNVIEMAFLWELPEDKPDLVPFMPPNWSAPIVPASVTGTTTHFSLTAGQPTYIDSAVINLGAEAEPVEFRNCIYLDGSEDPINCWTASQGMDPLTIYENIDLLLSAAPAAGRHSLAIRVDVDNVVDEANEDNNLWQAKFTWYPPGACGPFSVYNTDLVSISGLTDEAANEMPHAFMMPIEQPFTQPPVVNAEVKTNTSANLPNIQSGWAPVMVESFETGFPHKNGWILRDEVENDGCIYLWGSVKSHFDPPYGSNKAGWPAGGGTDGLDPSSSNYPPNSDSWMIYGPFDLSTATGALDARLSFDLRGRMEAPNDYLFVGASSDGVTFQGVTYSGNRQDWKRINFSLSSNVGQPEVWIAFRFVSDSGNQQLVYAEGPWIDNILLERAGSKIYLPMIRR